MPVDIETNLRGYLDGNVTSDGRMADERYASFDYCFNYFQSFRDAGAASRLASSENVEVSCMELGFYLASWGMYRPRGELFQKSARHLIPIIEVIAGSEKLIARDGGKTVWDVDVDCYTESNILLMLLVGEKIRCARPGMSDTLVTKIMLGVFGNVPAFDINFTAGCKAAGICGTFGKKSLKQLGMFYRKNATVIERYRVPTLDFVTGLPTSRLYTRAKVIDMAFFTGGFDLLNKP